MQTLFLELTLLVSLAVVVYLMATAVPKVEEDKETDGENGSRGSGHHFDRLDRFLLKIKDKFLRRLKVLVMKTDNLISKQLKNKSE